MSLKAQIHEAIRRRVPALWVDMADPNAIELELELLSREVPFSLCSWDFVRGLRVPNAPNPCLGDPVTAVRDGMLYRIAGRPTVLLLHNYYWFLNRIDTIQALLNAIGNARACGAMIIVVSPRTILPIELESHFQFLEPSFPTPEETRDLAKPLLDREDGESNRDVMLKALAGLTCVEIRGLVNQLRSSPPATALMSVQQQTEQIINQQTLLSKRLSSESFQTIAGMAALKLHGLRVLPSSSPTTTRGMFLLGPTGCGKTAFILALGNETGRPVYEIDWRRMGSAGADAERLFRMSIRRLEQMAPAILSLVDISTHIGRLAERFDGNAITRLWTALVEWMTSHRADIFSVATGSVLGKVPLELLHPDRLDSMFFVDLPNDETRRQLWARFREEFDIPNNVMNPSSLGWTGSEIRMCCRRSAFQDCDLLKAAASVVPYATVAPEPLATLRLWATGRAISAEDGGVFRHVPEFALRRQINPSVN